MILGTFREARGTLHGARSGGSDGEGEGGEELVGWLYMGSHNFTPSAWGTLSGNAFNPTLNVSVLILVERARSGTGVTYGGAPICYVPAR